MQVIENNKVCEKMYIEEMENGLKVVVVPKKTSKKYIVWSARFGSIDNKFYPANSESIVKLPDGIAHYLEHKLFEQENGRNSLDVLTSIGVDANAFTTNDHTAYLFECTENFDEALVEFMNYVQNPYFTDENVEKERGIIEQEIMMYNDYPDWSMYMNAMKAMYKDNEINIDVAGTKETIAEITKEKLYEAYNSFYYPENMILVLAGDFVPEEILEKIKSNLTVKKKGIEPTRVYNEEQNEIVEKYVESEMNISMPICMIGYKDNNFKDDIVKKDIAIEIISNIVFGKTSSLFKELYESGKILSEPGVNYEFSKNYGHVLIQFQSDFEKDVCEEIKNKLNMIKANKIQEESFKRAQKVVYGDFIRSYNDVSVIANGIVSDTFKGIDYFEYFNKFNEVNLEYTNKILNEIFDENNMVISTIKPLK